MPIEIAGALVDRCRLIKLKGKTKAAQESGWNTGKNYPISDPEIIKHVDAGNNCGLMPINGAMVIDCDTQQLYENLPKEWRKSLTVITGRSGNVGRHVFLLCPDSPPEKFSINDPKTDNPLGDLRGTNSKFYTVAAGSIHPDTGVKYKYLDVNAPLITVSWEDVRLFLNGYNKAIQTSIPVFNKTGESLSDKLGLHIEAFAMPIKPITRPNGDIQGAHPIHGSQTGMNFAINPKNGVWYCYRDGIGGDTVSWIAYTKCGVPEKDCTNLTKEQFKLVADWLQKNGYAEQIEKVNIDFLYKVPPLNFSKPNPDMDIDQEVDDARQRFSLAPFPEFESNLFNRYIKFGKRVSYSLEEYHFATMLSVVSMALRRRTLIQVGMSKVFPNVFIMITGHTTISGKSTACDMAIRNLARAVIYEDKFKWLSTNNPTGTISEAALVQGLADVNHSLWYYDECASFFDDMAWNKGILSRMCQVYDCGKVERTLSKRAKNRDDYHPVCDYPFMSILFNTTNTDLERIAKTELFSSGFFPRIMWFYGQGGQPRKNIEIKKEDWEILKGIYLEIKELKEDMDKFQNENIVFKVCDLIEDWKIKESLNHLGGKEDEAYRTAISRGFIHAYKIAVILAMVDKDFRHTKIFGKPPIHLDIPEKYAREAIKIVETYLIPRLVYVYNLCDNGDMRNHQNIVIKALNHYGGATTRSKLLVKTRLSRRDLNEALNTMEESGEIIVRSKVDNGNDKPTTYIIRSGNPN